MKEIRYIWEVIIDLNLIQGNLGTELLQHLHHRHRAIEKKKGKPIELVVRFTGDRKYMA